VTTHDPNEGPLLTPHAFVPGDALRGEHACKLCGLLPTSPRHALETSIADKRPSIAELQRMVSEARGIDNLVDVLRAQPVLLEIAAAALAWLDCPAKGLGSNAEHDLAAALRRVRR
jgi:hypothetical protein